MPICSSSDSIRCLPWSPAKFLPFGTDDAEEVIPVSEVELSRSAWFASEMEHFASSVYKASSNLHGKGLGALATSRNYSKILSRKLYATCKSYTVSPR